MMFPLGTSEREDKSKRFSKDVKQKLLGILGGEKRSKVTSTNLLLATSLVFFQKSSLVPSENPSFSPNKL